MTTARATSPKTAHAACAPTRTMSFLRVSAPRIEAPIEKAAHTRARQTARRPSSGTASRSRRLRLLGLLLGLLGLVLRRAAGHDLLGGERSLSVVSLDDHLASLGEHV